MNCQTCRREHEKSLHADIAKPSHFGMTGCNELSIGPCPDQSSNNLTLIYSISQSFVRIMGCSHNYVYTQGYFVCTKCSKKSHVHSRRRQSGKKIAAWITVVIVIGVVVLGYSNGILEVNQENLEQSLQKITDFVPAHLLDDVTTAISQIKLPDSAGRIIEDTTDSISQIKLPDSAGRIIEDTTDTISQIKLPDSAGRIIEDTTDTISQIKLPDSAGRIIEDTTDTISQIKLPDSAGRIIEDTTDSISKIELPDVLTPSPSRLESGFDDSLIEKHIYDFTNDERQQRGLSTLARVSAIDSIARNHSLDMSDRDYFSHISPEGNDPTDRGNESGYTCRKDFGSYYTEGLAENIYHSFTYSSYVTKGTTSSYNWITDEQTIAKELVDGWMDSPGHRENILDAQYDRIGVGVVITANENVYSTQNFC